MFYVLACKMHELYPEIIKWSWNYHEAGHGKGAPDGVGATVRRTADGQLLTDRTSRTWKNLQRRLRKDVPV